MPEPVRVGLAGAGPWAKMFHGPMIARSPDLEFAGVWARRPSAAYDLASTFSTTAFEDYKVFLGNCDAVVFSLPPSVQPGLAIAAARAGKALLLEKPLSDTLAQSEELVAEIESAGVPNLVNLTYRFYPNVREFLSQAASFDGTVPASRSSHRDYSLGTSPSDGAWNGVRSSISVPMCWTLCRPHSAHSPASRPTATHIVGSAC